MPKHHLEAEYPSRYGPTTMEGPRTVSASPSRQKLGLKSAITLSRRTESRVLGVLLAAFVAVGAWNVRVLAQASEISPAQAQATLQASIYLAAKSLDAELQETGSLPPTLDHLGIDGGGLLYRSLGNGYELVAEDGDRSISFRSGDDLGPFEAAFRALSGREALS
ncbi:hypothetical protein ACFL3S_02250 [Gemmatimonadota bacterium]